MNSRFFSLSIIVWRVTNLAPGVTLCIYFSLLLFGQGQCNSLHCFVAEIIYREKDGIHQFHDRTWKLYLVMPPTFFFVYFLLFSVIGHFDDRQRWQWRQLRWLKTMLMIGLRLIGVVTCLVICHWWSYRRFVCRIHVCHPIWCLVEFCTRALILVQVILYPLFQWSLHLLRILWKDTIEKCMFEMSWFFTKHEYLLCLLHPSDTSHSFFVQSHTFIHLWPYDG